MQDNSNSKIKAFLAKLRHVVMSLNLQLGCDLQMKKEIEEALIDFYNSPGVRG